MKHFYLLKLFPAGNFASGNQCINEVTKLNIDYAIKTFQLCHPELNLNNDGYAKHGDISYCVAERIF